MRDTSERDRPSKTIRRLDNLAEMRERCTTLALAHASISHPAVVSASERTANKTRAALRRLIQDSTYTNVYFGTWCKYIVKKGRAHSIGSSNSCWKNSGNFHRERASGGPVYLSAASNTFDSETRFIFLKRLLALKWVTCLPFPPLRICLKYPLGVEYYLDMKIPAKGRVATLATSLRGERVSRRRHPFMADQGGGRREKIVKFSR